MDVNMTLFEFLRRNGFEISYIPEWDYIALNRILGNLDQNLLLMSRQKRKKILETYRKYRRRK